MGWDVSGSAPLYVQLLEEMSLRIVQGRYAPGEKLPSVRDLAAEAGVNPNTMQRALTQLEVEGLVYAQRTAGRFVTEDSGVILRSKAALAAQHMTRYLQDMGALGYTAAEAAALLTEGKEA